jgi:hypothetical protein
LAVYGNGNLKLYEPLLKVYGQDQYWDPVACEVYVDGEDVGTSANFHVYSGIHNITVSVPEDYTFDRFTYGGMTSYSNPCFIDVDEYTYVTAHFVNLQPEFDLTIYALDQYMQFIPGCGVDVDGYPYYAMDGIYLTDLASGLHTLQVNPNQMPGYTFYGWLYMLIGPGGPYFELISYNPATTIDLQSDSVIVAAWYDN